jgi:hypothetical protein
MNERPKETRCSQNESTIARFRAFLKTLLSVPKKELDEAIEAERCAKESDVAAED